MRKKRSKSEFKIQPHRDHPNAVVVEFPGFKEIIALNPRLLIKQDISEKDHQRLLDLHIRLRRVFWLATKAQTDKDRVRVVDLVEKIEYKMQKTWKFSQDSRYHTHWMNVPGCQCPKMDNSDMLYSGRRIMVSDCPFHGKHLTTDRG